MGKAVPKKSLPLRPISAIVPGTDVKTKTKQKSGASLDQRPDAPATDGALDRLYEVILSRRGASPSVSHSARLLSRGTAKVAQKFGEEAVECLIEAVAGNHDALVAESADVLYHLLVLWVAGDVRPEEVWDELVRREGVSGLAEKAARPINRLPLAMKGNSSKIP